MFKDIFKKQLAFEVVGGKNILKKSFGNIYKMVSEEKEYESGVVNIKGSLYYYLGVNRRESYTRSAGKAAAGAIVGGVLTGGIGTIAGAALGGKKKDNSTFEIDLMEYETKRIFTLQVKPTKGHIHTFTDFPVAHIDVEEKLSTTDELLKYKQLLDAEAITLEEYETKKKELLNL